MLSSFVKIIFLSNPILQDKIPLKYLRSETKGHSRRQPLMVKENINFHFLKIISMSYITLNNGISSVKDVNILEIC